MHPPSLQATLISRNGTGPLKTSFWDQLPSIDSGMMPTWSIWMDPATGNQSQTKLSKKRWKKAKNQPKK
jgi:hypothetical protein